MLLLEEVLLELVRKVKLVDFKVLWIVYYPFLPPYPSLVNKNPVRLIIGVPLGPISSMLNLVHLLNLLVRLLLLSSLDMSLSIRLVSYLTLLILNVLLRVRNMDLWHELVVWLAWL